jgi:hypothetical protein
MGLRLLFTLSSLLLSFGVFAQQNGSFKALELPTNARTAAVGGFNVALGHDDVNMLLDNPALMSATMHQHTALNYYNYYAGIQYTSLAYARQLGKSGSLGAGLQYFAYGQLEGYDASGEKTQDFSAADYAMTVAYSHQKGNFRLGVNMKYAVSAFDTYQAHLLAADLGGVFQHPEKDLTVGLVVKNAGFLLKDYSAAAQSKAPFDVQAGIAFKPDFMPFRFSFTAYDLLEWKNPPQQTETEEQQTFADHAGKAFRHLAIGAELLLHKNLHIRAGYNYQHRSELRLEQKAGGAGFAYGFLFKIKAFQFAYSRSVYHAAGGTHFLSLSSNLKRVF